MRSTRHHCRFCNHIELSHGIEEGLVLHSESILGNGSSVI